MLNDCEFCPATHGKAEDRDKLRMELVEPSLIEAVAAAMTANADRDRGDWKSRLSSEESYAKLMRHLMRWRSGEKTDERGVLHLHAVAANLMFLIWFEQREQK